MLQQGRIHILRAWKQNVILKSHPDRKLFIALSFVVRLETDGKYIQKQWKINIKGISLW